MKTKVCILLCARIIVFTLSSSEIFADSIMYEGTQYENAYITESATAYYIAIPENGSVIRAPKRDVDASSLVISSDTALRNALKTEWQSQRDLPKGSPVSNSYAESSGVTNVLSAAEEALVQGKWETLVQLEDTLKKDPETAVIASDLRGYALYMLGHYNEPRTNQSRGLTSFYEKMTSEYPESVHVRLALALAYIQESRLSQGIETLEKARKMDSANPHILTALGVAKRNAGQVDKAINLQLKAIALDSELCPAYAALGAAYLFQNKLGDAQRVLQNGVDVCPDYAATWSNLGVVFRRQGAFDRAIECYEKAISLAPGDPVDYLNLGAAFAHKEEYDKARQAWEKATELDPKGSAGASARRNLLRLPK